MSQPITERVVKSFYERLYTPTVPLTSFIPPPKEAFAPFQKDEAMAALSSLRLGRSPGPDQVASEQLVLAHESIAEQLTVLLNKLIEGDDVPAPLVQATVTLLYKKRRPERHRQLQTDQPSLRYLQGLNPSMSNEDGKDSK